MPLFRCIMEWNRFVWFCVTILTRFQPDEICTHHYVSLFDQPMKHCAKIFEYHFCFLLPRWTPYYMSYHLELFFCRKCKTRARNVFFWRNTALLKLYYKFIGDILTTCCWISFACYGEFPTLQWKFISWAKNTKAFLWADYSIFNFNGINLYESLVLGVGMQIQIEKYIVWSPSNKVQQSCSTKRKSAG